ncbi:SDR family NAD(P)-dependent oxidoreductase [Streptomyces sp. NBC_01764]|uniref:SDR family NAD(P)-dependent oxidoreductase n=1 Tax=Streptomyces sp. NBC_01764 TaxID=2975935 RepID=UPI002259E0C1|nr:SDR family NAD(P)-dependent oxidoreductase [Streptomyces sp. NBC_01764]MCX4404148.1 SDR family NAD(P)-dependent oxidoreductase [Streptomyces sp. NBC_01764]
MIGLSAVVTGGSRGLGLLLAEQLLIRGCAVTIAARDTGELGRARDILTEGRPGARVRAVACDVTDRASVATLMAEAADVHGGIDVVIANAGIIQVAPLESIEAEAFRSAMETIYLGALHASLEALPWLRRSQGGGRLALIGSVGGLLAVPHLLPYSCAKSAVAALAEGLHAELRGHGVSVTAVHPGLMRTGSHLAAEFGGNEAAEFAWFSALAGSPLVSMDARRAADRIVTAVERRRTRIVLTPMAKAAGLTHGVAPALTTRLSALAARALPSPPEQGQAHDMHKGRDVEPGPDRALHPAARRLRDWGSALNDRAARRLNQNQRPDHAHSST